MMKVYHMIIARKSAEDFDDHSTRREYLSTRQGSAPTGWVCLGVCGYHEEPTRHKYAPEKEEARP